MFAQREKYKNQFLQLELRHLRPEKINEWVHKEMVQKQSRRQTCNVLEMTKRVCKSAMYFEDRAELAYGFRALPKLMKHLGSDDYLMHWRTLNSLSEYIQNPLFAQRAIKQFDIVRRIQNIFVRIRLKFRQIKFHEISRLLHIFYYLAMHRNAAKQITGKIRLLDQFYIMLNERSKHFEDVAKILPLLTMDTDNCLKLIHDYGVYDKLISIWTKDPCISFYSTDLWKHLSHVLEVDPDEAIKRGFFEVLHKRIRGRLLNYHIWDMKCFGLLLRYDEGQRRFMLVDGIKLLYDILNEEVLDTYEHVMFCLVNGLFAKRVLWRCREFTDLPLLVTGLAQNSKNTKQQLFCLQALREMGVMPVIKRYIKANCLENLKNLNCEALLNQNDLKELIHWLEREIYRTSNLKLELRISELE